MKFEFMPRYTKYLCWYRSFDKVAERRSNPIATAFIMLLILFFMIISFSLISKCSETKHPVYASHFSNQEIDFIIEFAKNGSSHPIEMGLAVCKTKNPPLMAALAIKESNGRPKAIGDSGLSKGAFQVQEKHWGKVPNTATEQALQAEKIIDELVASSPRGNLRSGLAKYNGGVKPPKSSYRYADSVLKLMKEV